MAKNHQEILDDYLYIGRQKILIHMLVRWVGDDVLKLSTNTWYLNQCDRELYAAHVSH